MNHLEQKKNNPKSLLMLIASAVIFGTIGIFRKYIPLSSALLAALRGGIGAAVLFCVMLFRKEKKMQKIEKKKLFWLCVTGMLMGLNWILLFEAFNYTSVATATLCYYMEPTIVMLLAPLLFKEKLTGKKMICAIISVIGMVFVSGIVEAGIPQLSEMKGILLGLSAACLYSAVVILNKKLPGIDTYQKTIIELLSAAIVLVPYLIAAGSASFLASDTSIAVVILLVLVVGLIHTGIAYVLYFGSMDGLKTQTIAIFSYLDPITALVLSMFLLGEQMSVLGLVGAVMIIAAAAYGEISE